MVSHRQKTNFSRMFLSQLTCQFDAALANGHLKLSRGGESRIAILESDGIPFQLRILPSLAKKRALPTSLPNESDSGAREKRNPFLPPDQHLLIREVNEYNIVFNKFCVVPDHFLLCSKAWRNQQSPLTENDFAMAWNLLNLVASDAHPSEYLCFYNAGLQSGASQPHFHKQFLPAAGKRIAEFDGAAYGIPVSKVIPSDAIAEPVVVTIKQYPFKHALGRIPSSWTYNAADCAPCNPATARNLLKLYRSCMSSVFTSSQLETLDSIDPAAPEMSSSWPSFNFVMTRGWMLVVPRKQEFAEVDGLKLSVNSLGMAGMILCKSEHEAHALHNPIALLKQLTYPPN